MRKKSLFPWTGLRVGEGVRDAGLFQGTCHGFEQLHFPPSIFYFVLWQDPLSATVSSELHEALVRSLFQETPADLVRGLKTWEFV